MPVTAKSSPLVSDILEAQFGPVAVRVLAQTDTKRIVAIYVKATNQVVQYAEVDFDPAGVGLYPLIHRKIRGGAIMGKSFRAAGVPYRRGELSRTAYRLPQHLKKLFGTDQSTGTRIEVVFEVGPGYQAYARNIEIFSPAVIWPE